MCVKPFLNTRQIANESGKAHKNNKSKIRAAKNALIIVSSTTCWVDMLNANFIIAFGIRAFCALLGDVTAIITSTWIYFQCAQYLCHSTTLTFKFNSRKVTNIRLKYFARFCNTLLVLSIFISKQYFMAVIFGHGSSFRYIKVSHIFSTYIFCSIKKWHL